VDKEDEYDLLRGLLTESVERGLRQTRRTEFMSDEQVYAVAQITVSSMIRRLRVLSARQLGVILEDRPNRHESWVIHEPPKYVES
jgi:hypothetical protein